MNRRRLASLMAASALIIGMFGLSAGGAAAAVKYATVWGHYASSAGDKSNEGDFWVNYLNTNAQAGLEEGDCWKLSDSDFNAVNNGDGTADLGVGYGWVIVKQASSSAVNFDNTIFKDVAADETVFADTDGDGSYGEGDSHGISHIIVCSPTETSSSSTTTSSSSTTTTTDSSSSSTTTTESSTTTTTSSSSTTTTTTETFSGGSEPATDAPTQPNTAVASGGPSTPSNSAWMLILALGLLLGSVVVLTPAKSKAKN
jgi:hypothetical protein